MSLAIHFVAETSEWLDIGKSLKGLCSRINSDLHFISWEPTDKDSSNEATDADLLIFPLFEFEKNEIKPCGLKNTRLLRKALRNYDIPILYLVNQSTEVPNVYEPEMETTQYVNAILGNPDFGDVEKATLCAEMIFERSKNGQNEKHNIFILNVLDILSKKFRQNFEDFIIKLDPNNGNDERFLTNTKYREYFYGTFIDFYDPFPDLDHLVRKIKTVDVPWEDSDSLIDKLRSTTIKKGVVGLPSFISYANELHNRLNGISLTVNRAHRVPAELFRAPVPFCLQELTDARIAIEKVLGVKEGDRQRRISLFLVDNKIDKIRKIKNECPLQDLFEEFKLNHLFDLEMGENIILTEKNGEYGFFKKNTMAGVDIVDISEQSVVFDFRKFREQLNCYLDSCKKENKKLEDLPYLSGVYKKVKDSHFVLLDFFLNRENTYLAFDFIKDIGEIKRREGNFSIAWFFITSAIYDSVVKYAQSGLLAEHHEFAVVSAGDDPTNEMRQIIFVYKLLSFINARLSGFSYYLDDLCRKVLRNYSGNGGYNPCYNWTKNCKGQKCLNEFSIKLKKFRIEFDDLHSLFYSEENKKDMDIIIDGLEKVIQNFLWLPEADWPVVQKQIDLINSRLKRIPTYKERHFSCDYINKAMKERSERY